MSRLRLLVPRRDANGTSIISFDCSECSWQYLLQERTPYSICYADAERACKEFDGHRCSQFTALSAVDATPVIRARRVYDSRCVPPGRK
jgi:hypothetical protein